MKNPLGKKIAIKCDFCKAVQIHREERTDLELAPGYVIVGEAPQRNK